jgi:hypothetical protein
VRSCLRHEDFLLPVVVISVQDLIRFFNFDIVSIGKPSQRFNITVLLMVHEEADGVTAFAAAETFINFFEGETVNEGVFSL